MVFVKPSDSEGHLHNTVGGVVLDFHLIYDTFTLQIRSWPVAKELDCSSTWTGWFFFDAFLPKFLPVVEMLFSASLRRVVVGSFCAFVSLPTSVCLMNDTIWIREGG